MTYIRNRSKKEKKLEIKYKIIYKNKISIFIYSFYIAKNGKNYNTYIIKKYSLFYKKIIKIVI